MLLLDFLGYGFSAKPDQAYTLAEQADVVVAFTAALGIDRLALLSHDMGDTVGGELLARQLDGTWPVEVTRRVLTNGSIYIGMAQLSPGQQLLLALPDDDDGRRHRRSTPRRSRAGWPRRSARRRRCPMRSWSRSGS